MALTPVASLISAVTATGFTITVDVDGNPAPPATYYSFKVVFGAETKYVNSLGQLQNDQEFLPVLSVAVTNATPNTTHSVTLTAADDALGIGESSSGPASLVVTDAAQPAAASFTNLFSTTVMAHWGANGNPDGTEYEVEISPNVSFLSGVISSGIITDLGYTFTNLLPSTTYYGRVRARNSALVYTPYTSLGSVFTPVGPNPVRAIRVYNLLAERGYIITWQPNQETNIASYKVYRSESPTDTANFKLLATVPVTQLQHTDKVPFTFGIVFYYVVAAVDDGGNESSISQTTPAHENTFHSFEEQPFVTTVSATDFVHDEEPVGVVDTVNVLFTTLFPYRPGTVELYLNGVKLIPIEDFNEGPLPQQITFTDPPNTDGEIRVSYIKFGV
jgi:hypothetical protein